MKTNPAQICLEKLRQAVVLIDEANRIEGDNFGPGYFLGEIEVYRDGLADICDRMAVRNKRFFDKLGGKEP